MMFLTPDAQPRGGIWCHNMLPVVREKAHSMYERLGGSTVDINSVGILRKKTSDGKFRICSKPITVTIPTWCEYGGISDVGRDRLLKP